MITCGVYFSQVVFCPPGAEWNYYFSGDNNNLKNERIKYERDSLINQFTCKIISHSFFYKYGFGGSSNKTFTLLKQSGDTVFFRNKYSAHTWQILYNFAATSGQSWYTTVSQTGVTVDTHTFTVDSVKNISTNNGQTLKNMYVKVYCYSNTATGSPKVENIEITERFGGKQFFFNLYSSITQFHGMYFNQFLCYNDPQIGEVKFSQSGCTVTEEVGLTELNTPDNTLVHFPNPCSNQLNINSDILIRTVELFDLSGKSVFTKTFDTQQNTYTIDVSQLAQGLYIAQLQTEKGKQFVKVVKE